MRVLNNPERVRFFADLDDDLVPVVHVEILVTRDGDDWGHLKTFPAAFLVLDRDVHAVIDAAVAGVKVPDDPKDLL